MMIKEDKLILAVDIGGSKFVVGFMDFEGNVMHQQRYPWFNPTAEMLFEKVAEKVDVLFREHPSEARRVVVAGMTLPGIANPKTGIWLNSGYMKINNLPIAEPFEKKWGIPVYVDNDCKACALAERYFGAAKNCNDFFYLTASNGVGGAVFTNGHLYYGATGRSAEIGCCVIRENGRLSDEGTVRGNLEMYACGRGLVKNYLEAGGNETVDGHAVDGLMIAELAQKGDYAALKALELEGYYLGKGIAWACCFFDPAKVIIGGGLSMIFDLYKDKLLETFAENYGLQEAMRIQIVPTPLGYFGALMGAGTLGIRGYQNRFDDIPDHF